MESQVVQLDPQIAARVYDLRVQRLEAVLRDLAEMESLGRSLTSDADWRTEDPALLSNFSTRGVEALSDSGAVMILANESRSSFKRCRDPEILALHARVYERAGEFTKLSNGLREHLMAAELGVRLQSEDPVAVDEALIDWRIDQSETSALALEHIFTRAPREGGDHRWREVMRQSSHEGVVRWINSSTTRAARDVKRRGVPKSGVLARDKLELDEEDIRKIDARILRARLSPQEAEFACRILRGGTTTDAAAAIVVKGSTARTLRQRIRKKFSAAGDEFV